MDPRLTIAPSVSPEAAAVLGVIGQAIAAMPPLAALAVKEQVNIAVETTLAQGVLFERRLFHGLFGTEDQKEGMSAFAEKREAQFRDR